MLIALYALMIWGGFGVLAWTKFRSKRAQSDLKSLRDWLFGGDNTKSGSTDKSNQSEKGRLLQIDEGDLLSKAQCEELPKESWQRQAYEDVKTILLAKDDEAQTFPCIYATAGYKQDQHRYVFMHSDDASEPRNMRLVANALRAYLPLSHSLGPNTSMLVIHPPSKKQHSVDDYRQKFWSVLRGLRSCDLEPWPEAIPAETDTPKWAFCFDGVPWFLAAMTPAHEQRRSRRAPNFIIAVQPKWVFTHLFRTPERRRAAVEAVRKLMPAYDDIDISPDLAAYGDQGSTEAHQYYLMDENKTARCPFEDLDA